MQTEFLFPTEPSINPISWSQLQQVLQEGSINLLTQDLSVDATLGAEQVAPNTVRSTSLFLDYFCTVGRSGSFESILPEKNAPIKINFQAMIVPIKKELKAKHLFLPYSIEGRCLYLGKMRESCQLYLVFPPADTANEEEIEESKQDSYII